MKFSSSLFLYLAVGVIVVGLIAYAVVKGQAPSIYDSFAQCLTEKNVKMYGAWWCPHCQNQKKLFGKSFDFIEYIECSVPGSQAMNELCKQAGIQGYPTWEFGDGNRMSGEQSLQTLAEKTGCTLTVDDE